MIKYLKVLFRKNGQYHIFNSNNSSQSLGADLRSEDVDLYRDMSDPSPPTGEVDGSLEK